MNLNTFCQLERVQAVGCFINWFNFSYATTSASQFQGLYRSTSTMTVKNMLFETKRNKH